MARNILNIRYLLILVRYLILETNSLQIYIKMSYYLASLCKKIKYWKEHKEIVKLIRESKHKF